MADDPNSTKPAASRATAEPAWWPADPPCGQTFLLRFVNEIGFRVFPDWTGTEVTGDRLPELAEATSYDELWRLAQRWVEDDHDTPALRRLRCIRAEIIRQSYAGTLLLTVRRVSGGPFEAFQSEWWNRDKPNKLFNSCTIDPKYPFGGRPNGEPNTNSWIFAPCEGIEQIAAHLEAKPQFPPTGSINPPKPPVAETLPVSAANEETAPAPVSAMNASTPGACTESPPQTDAISIAIKPELDEEGARADLAKHGLRSIRVMAKEWGWHRSRVFRFVARPKAETSETGSETPSLETETARETPLLSRETPRLEAETAPETPSLSRKTTPPAPEPAPPAKLPELPQVEPVPPPILTKPLAACAKETEPSTAVAAEQEEEVEVPDTEREGDLDEPALKAKPAEQEPQQLIELFRSGGPGRPTALAVVLWEAQRRITAGEYIPKKQGLSNYASVLSQWWESKRMKFEPPAPAVREKTIINNFSKFYYDCLRRIS
jgi:hypothetical protein